MSDCFQRVFDGVRGGQPTVIRYRFLRRVVEKSGNRRNAACITQPGQLEEHHLYAHRGLPPTPYAAERPVSYMPALIFFRARLRAVSMAPAASNTQTDNRVIDRVEFEGLQTLDAAYLQSVVRILPGSMWNRDEIAKACTRLAETGKFDANPYAEPREHGRLILVFVVKAALRSRQFNGNHQQQRSARRDRPERRLGYQRVSRRPGSRCHRAEVPHRGLRLRHGAG
jgi:hypothetical protein